MDVDLDYMRSLGLLANIPGVTSMTIDDEQESLPLRSPPSNGVPTWVFWSGVLVGVGVVLLMRDRTPAPTLELDDPLPRRRRPRRSRERREGFGSLGAVPMLCAVAAAGAWWLSRHRGTAPRQLPMPELDGFAGGPAHIDVEEISPWQR